MSRPESPARPEGRIRTRARFTPTLSIILSKHFLCYFSLGFRFAQKHFQMVGPQHLHFIKYNYIEGILCPFKMIYKTKHLLEFHYLFTKYSMFKKEMICMAGYVLIRLNSLYDSALRSCLLSCLLKPAHR